MSDEERNKKIMAAMRADFGSVKSKGDSKKLLIKRGILTKSGNLKAEYKRTLKSINKAVA